MTPEQAKTAWDKAIADHAARQQIDNPGLAGDQLSPDQARERLDRHFADKDWVSRFERGSPAAKEEFTRLTTQIANGDRLGQILAGNDKPLPFQTTIGKSAGGDDLTDADLRIAAKTLREAGLNDDAIRQAVEGRPVTKAERNLVQQFKRARESDASWRKALFDGDLEARREHALMAIVLAAPVEDAA